MEVYMYQDIRQQLETLAEEKYRVFTSSLTPGKENILGVRLPLLRKLAKQLAKEDWRSYLKEAQDSSMEEVLLQAMVIGYCNAGIEEKLELVAAFVPKIDCWPVCDSFCTGLKIAVTQK
jgi:3-methyladenine DNA glycosylase AlkD